MHTLIAIVVEANTHSAAVERAEYDFTSRYGDLGGYFDSWHSLNDDSAHFRGEVPEQVLKDGAVPADSEAGIEILERLWESQLKALRRHLSVLKTALETTDSMVELLDDPRVEADVETYSPLGLATSDSVMDTVEHRVLYSMYVLAGVASCDIRIYRKWDRPVKGTGDYEQLLDTIKGNDDHWVVPLDVHS